MSQFNISVIVPVFNESAQIAQLKPRLQKLQEFVKEVIIVDGGSQDDTVAFLQQEFHVVRSEQGRAKQMNTGAQIATGCWLFFLHADTDLTFSHVEQALSHSTKYNWGRFDVALSGRHWMFRVIEFMINKRSRLTGIATGDQCIFVRKAVFDTLKGYAELPLMEDVELSKRLVSQFGRPVCIKHPVRTSSRRWEKNGIFKTIFLMWQLRYRYWKGTHPEELARLYYPNDHGQSSQDSKK